MRISVIGTAGIPANYGGFETLVQNLSEFHQINCFDTELVVYCSAKNYEKKPARYLNTELRHLPISANGIWSIPYDIWSFLKAALERSDTILVLGVSGAVVLPIVRCLSNARVVTNIDGVEWRREKWKGIARWFLRFSEKMAVRYSHAVIADNGGIADYVKLTYGAKAHVIAYGGDHATTIEAIAIDNFCLPDKFVFAVCRIEPENNVHIVLEAFDRLKNYSLVIVGNWNYSEYGSTLRNKYIECRNLFLLDPIYDLGQLKSLRLKASHFVHGHSAGGTNPSLVEAMHFGKPVLAFDCIFNRRTTEEKAFFFKTSADLVHLMATIGTGEARAAGRQMLEIAQRRYTWHIVAEQYFSLLKAA